jgi:hypothetical protein
MKRYRVHEYTDNGKRNVCCRAFESDASALAEAGWWLHSWQANVFVEPNGNVGQVIVAVYAKEDD